MDGLMIGDVAARAAVNIETLRYYERRGLIPRPPRDASNNYRRYPHDAVLRVRFVKRAQELGFSLHEVKELLSLRAAPKGGCADVRTRADEKLKDIEQRMRSLRAMRKALRGLVAQCAGRGPVSECPILEALASEETA
jgi:MerR family mercuric resistance operon transcriptional regulator